MPGPGSVVTLWSDVGGQNQGPIPVLARQRMKLRLDGRWAFDFEAADGLWRFLAKQRRSVVRVELHGGRATYEWRLMGIQYGKGAGDGTVKVHCEALTTVLTDLGHLRVRDGSINRFSLGARMQTPRYYLETFVQAYAQEKGAGWFTIGDVENDGLYTVDWNAETGQWLVQELAERTLLEPLLKYHGPGDHRLHMLQRIGSEQPLVVVSDGRNLLSVIRTQSPQGFASAAIGFGGVPEGGTERATMGLAAWRVAAVGATTVTLEDRNGGDPPDLQDDQSAGRYLRSIDGVLHLIVSTVAGPPCVFTLEAGHPASFAVDDDVEIRLDAEGRLVDSLTDPEADVYVEKQFVVDDYRGERNYALNPLGEDVTTPPSAVPAGTVSNGFVSPGATTWSIRGITPANRVIPAGSVVTVIVAPTYVKVHRTTGSATASGGVASLAVDPPMGGTFQSVGGTVPDGTPVVIYERPGNAPDRWDVPDDGTLATPILQVRPATLKDLEGNVDLGAGDQDGPMTFQGPATAFGTADGEIYPGDAIGTAQGWRPVLLPASLDSSGEALLYVGRHSQSAAGSMGAGVQAAKLYRPRFPIDRPQESVVTSVARRQSDGAATIFLAPKIGTEPKVISPVTGIKNVQIVVEVTIRGTAGLSPAGAPGVPKIEVYNGTTLIAQGAPTAPVVFPSAASPQDQSLVLSALVPLDQPLNLSTKLVLPSTSTVTFTGQFFTFVRSFMEQIGSEDPNAPPAWPSHGTAIWQDSNRRLQLYRHGRDEWGFQVREFWQRWVNEPPEPKIELGGELLAVTSLNGMQGVRFRFTEVDYALDDPGDTRFRALSRLEEAMQLIERRIKKASRGDTSVKGGTLVMPGSTPTSPPAQTPGAGAGSGGTNAGGSIFLATSATHPVPNHLGDYVHEQDVLNILQWFPAKVWDEILDSTRGDHRVAMTRGAEMAVTFVRWHLGLHGFRPDDDGRRILDSLLAARDGTTMLAGDLVRVVHGSDPDVPRPLFARYVEWIGDVEPNEATDDDSWLDTS